MTNILVTGGAGYIGSHTLVELISAGLEPIVLDNLCNSSQISLQRVEAITGKKIRFIEGDVRDAALLERVFGDRKSTRLNSSHVRISYAVFCLKKNMTNIFC